jgi:hypothetical protein
MADIFRGLLVTELRRQKVQQSESSSNFLLETTPTIYTVGSSLEWPVSPRVARQQPQLYGLTPLFFPDAVIPPPIPSTLMGQACL